ncbi:MAG: RibD family protein [Pseudanabaenaceae cyanobacterium bins.39]|nr:RibD family protein [Pseudanabaenaceae cyanobacterium bins.39]
MYDSLRSCRDRIYDFAELNFPLDGVKFAGQYDRPYIVFNMVASVDGKATTCEGRLDQLGSRPDRYLLKRLRSQVDAVMAGANTLRQDPFIPTIPDELVTERLVNFATPQPLGIVVSGSGDLPQEHRFWNADRDVRLVVTGEGVAIAPWLTAQVLQLPMHQGQIDLAKLLNTLFTDFGIRVLLVEGGATLNYALISQGFADEIFLSVAPYIIGGTDNLSIVAGDSYGLGCGNIPKLELRSVYTHASELFLRYRFT